MAGEQEIDQQKAALLAAIAQQGSQGQVAFDAEAARRSAAQQAAVAAVNAQSKMTGAGGAAPAAFTAQLQGQTAALGDVYAQDAAMSNTAFKNSLAQTSASNAAYMDQARAALPVVQAQTAGTVAQIRAEQEAAAAARAEAQAERDYQAEQRALERETATTEADTTAADDLIEQAQLHTLAESKSSAPIVGAIMDQLAEFPDLKTAVAALPNIRDAITADLQRESGKEKIWTRKDHIQLYKYLYEFFNPGAKAGPDPSALGLQYMEQGIDPRGVIPDYVPPSQGGGGGGGTLGDLGSSAPDLFGWLGGGGNAQSPAGGVDDANDSGTIGERAKRWPRIPHPGAKDLGRLFGGGLKEMAGMDRESYLVNPPGAADVVAAESTSSTAYITPDGTVKQISSIPADKDQLDKVYRSLPVSLRSVLMNYVVDTGKIPTGPDLPLFLQQWQQRADNAAQVVD